MFGAILLRVAVSTIVATLALPIVAANVIHQEGSSPIVLLATNATTHGKTIRYEPQPHKNTIGFWTRAEEWVSWDFVVVRPGNYNVTLTQSCGKGSGGSEYTVSTAAQTIRDVVPDTGSFTNWVERTVGKFTFTNAGAFTISVKPVKKPGLAVMDLRAITLTPQKMAPAVSAPAARSP